MTMKQNVKYAAVAAVLTWITTLFVWGFVAGVLNATYVGSHHYHWFPTPGSHLWGLTVASVIIGVLLAYLAGSTNDAPAVVKKRAEIAAERAPKRKAE